MDNQDPSDLTITSANTRPGTIIRDRSNRKAYYYEDDGSLRLIHHAIIQSDGKVVISSLAVQARITYLQKEYGSG